MSLSFKNGNGVTSMTLSGLKVFQVLQTALRKRCEISMHMFA